MSSLFDKTFGLIENAMDVRLKRHSVLSTNLVNSDTPNYKAREVDFKAELEKAYKSGEGAMKKTHEGHLDVSQSYAKSPIMLDTSMPIKPDGNNVDSDVMMGRVADNAGAYQTAADYMFIKIRLLRFAARGGRGGV